MMIPGAWEARRRSGNPVDVVEAPASAPKQPEAGRGGNETLFAGPPDTEHPELPGWLKVSIFAGTLLTAMWLAMMVFFD